MQLSDIYLINLLVNMAIVFDVFYLLAIFTSHKSSDKKIRAGPKHSVIYPRKE